MKRDALLPIVVALLALAAWSGTRTTVAQDGGGSRSSRHASLTEGVDCANCHTADSWDMAGGVGAGRGFDHARTGFPLTGRHALSACVECHRPAVTVRRECNACHEDDYHQGRLGRQCDRCHTSSTWNDTNALEVHRTTRLPLTGMHVLLDCTECHARTGEREYTAVPADCYACHADDYRRPETHPSHTGATGDEPFPRDCGLCHVASGWAPALFDPASIAASTSPLTLAPPEHEVVFPIRRGPHRGATCGQCHVVPDLPRVIDCAGCHDPVTLARQHEGAAISPDARGCLGCHPGGMGR